MRSVIVGFECVLISLPIGLAAGLALYRYRVRGRALLGASSFGLLEPAGGVGDGLPGAVHSAGLIGALWALSVAVVTVNFPFMLLAIGSSIDQLNPELEEAATTMGAEQVQTFLFVTLPGVMPGVLIGSISCSSSA